MRTATAIAAGVGGGVVLLLVVAVAATTTRERVAVVDMERVQADSQVVKSINASIQDDAARLQKQVDDIKAEAGKLRDAKAPAADVDAKLRAASESADRANALLRQRQAARDQRVIAEATRAAMAIGAQRGLDVVIPLGGKPLYAKTQVDVTAEVIARIDADDGRGAEVAKLRAEVDQMRSAQKPPSEPNAGGKK